MSFQCPPRDRLAQDLGDKFTQGLGDGLMWSGQTIVGESLQVVKQVGEAKVCELPRAAIKTDAEASDPEREARLAG